LKREFSVADIYQLRSDLAVLERSFGKAKMETLDYYQATMSARGFEKIERRDISREVFPTLRKWKENLDGNRALLRERLSDDDVEDFARSCEILQDLFARELLGYGILSGRKGRP
jgi:hypothetical protein